MIHNEAIPAGIAWRGDLLCELLNIRLRTTDVYNNIRIHNINMH